MFMATVESVPWPHDVLGLVISTGGQPNQLLRELDKQARAMGADGVLGLRFFSANAGVAESTTAYGTAIRRQP